MLGNKVLILGTMTSGEMIAFEPNAKEKGVSLVAHIFVVRYAHRHPGSSSVHFPFLLERDFLRESMIALLDALAFPLP
ncbi:hypothetical protein EV1_014872 [Malus domestica]